MIEETISEVLPVKVADIYAGFAEVKNLGQGDKPIFRRKITSAKIRAKQFITRVGLAGRYEVFKLGGSESFEIKTSAVGGAAQIGIEEFLDGRVDFAEVTAIVMEGMDDRIYAEIANCLIAAVDNIQTATVIKCLTTYACYTTRDSDVAEAYAVLKSAAVDCRNTLSDNNF